ncbi:hypothetical protein SAMN05660776_0457 [Salegentibacter holothuriorum]|uniref:Beta-ketoacyl synthase, N-terminal domain n=1 Tax=Salegentibacter holothuriorum TaxID=241145 RepID=A0A1T5ADI3_9FLAO|nr:hypothetical protein [Salegentibacter holothuriorum]SKB33092.1 hypothetical protein SAMN05660776_0457 [Salegentibacter holothuriorum]
MQQDFYIKNWVKIKNGKVSNSEKVIFNSSETDLSIFFKAVYNFLELKYPKFHKMDGLSKLGILGAEILFREHKISPDTALILSNNASSLETDRQFHESISSFASPTLFVYTLPNIVLGEISIKFKLQSENAFFVSDSFNAELLKNYSESLLTSGKSSEVLCGWLDLENGEYDVFLCLVSPEINMPFSEENLKKLYFAENEKPTSRT